MRISIMRVFKKPRARGGGNSLAEQLDRCPAPIRPACVAQPLTCYAHTDLVARDSCSVRRWLPGDHAFRPSFLEAFISHHPSLFGVQGIKWAKARSHCTRTGRLSRVWSVNPVLPGAQGNITNCHRIVRAPCCSLVIDVLRFWRQVATRMQPIQRRTKRISRLLGRDINVASRNQAEDFFHAKLDKGKLVVRSRQKHPCGRVNRPTKQWLVDKIRRTYPSDFIH
jgi:hypothetical protein